MALDLIQFFGDAASWLMNDSQSGGAPRIIRRVWLIGTVGTAVGAVVLNIAGGIGGYLDVPADTKKVFVFASALVLTITVVAVVVSVIVSIIQKFGSILGRGTGNANVHPD